MNLPDDIWIGDELEVDVDPWIRSFRTDRASSRYIRVPEWILVSERLPTVDDNDVWIHWKEEYRGRIMEIVPYHFVEKYRKYIDKWQSVYIPRIH